MPVIEMSAGFAAGLPSRMMRFGESYDFPYDASNTGLLNAGHMWGNINGPAVYLYLMRGAVPVSFPSQISARQSDILVSYVVNNTSGGNFLTSQVTTNPVIVSTEYVTASQSGTATWFWWVCTSTVGFANTTPGNTLFQQIIGTVGLPGSGNDLEVPSTTITAGEQYRVLNLRLQFPTSWTY